MEGMRKCAMGKSDVYYGGGRSIAVKEDRAERCDRGSK